VTTTVTLFVSIFNLFTSLLHLLAFTDRDATRSRGFRGHRCAAKTAQRPIRPLSFLDFFSEGKLS